MRKYGDPPRPKGPRPAVPPPMRGKRGQERRLGERITAEALDRLLAEREVRPEVDFDIGDAEAEAAEAIEAEAARGRGAVRRETRRGPTRRARPTSLPSPVAAPAACRTCRPCRRSSPSRARSLRSGSASAIRPAPCRPPDAMPA